jgi:hypothetical protein
MTLATFRVLTTRTEVTAQVDGDDRLASVESGMTGRRAALEDAELLKLLYDLRLSRAFEERLSILIRQGKVVGGVFRSQDTEAWFVHRPGLKVVYPSTPCRMTPKVRQPTSL